MLFEELGLHEGLLRAVVQQGYSQPTPIQQRAIPVVLKGGDLLAAAQTGTGKTAAFTLPLLHRLIERREQGQRTQPKRPTALVLTPTRELAAQVAESVRTYGGHLPFKTTVIFGGVNINPQIDVLRHGVDILVATPGRLLDHVGQRTVDLSAVEILVLDEADRMLDMGFIHDIRRVLAALPKQRQNLMFSATFSDDIRKLATSFLHAPETIDIAPRNSAAETVEQRVVLVDKARKSELLAYLISSSNWQQTLVFTRTKHGANRLVEKLEKWDISSAALHGNKSQNARTKALADFKAGSVKVLVATDIAARGLDIEQLPHVVNFELPNVPEDYVHRIGRTGRAGVAGEAISLVSADEQDELKAIRKLLRKELPGFVVEGFEIGSVSPNPEPAEAPRPPRPQGQRRHNGGAHKAGANPRRGGGHQHPHPQSGKSRSGQPGGQPAAQGRGTTERGPSINVNRGGESEQRPASARGHHRHRPNAARPDGGQRGADFNARPRGEGNGNRRDDGSRGHRGR
jgi:ATP-dependent RNA helicase RhlE